jgi:predicted nucleic acid-binding protein
VSEVVIDASAALSFFLPTQSTGAADEFLESRDRNSFIAPYAFVWDVGNVLVRLRLRGLLPLDSYQDVSDVLADLDISIAAATPVGDVAALGELAASEGLRLFDAAYLALAVERGCGLASRDERLLQAARSIVPTYDLLGERLT